MICYDLEFPEWVRVAALSGADLIAVPVNWNAPGSTAPAGERSGEVVVAQAAAANGVFIAVADRCGTEAAYVRKKTKSHPERKRLTPPGP